MLASEIITGILPEVILMGAKSLKKKTKERKYTLVISIIFMLVDITGIILNELFLGGNSNILAVCFIVFICLIYIIAICLFSFIVSDSNVTVTEQLDKIVEERTELNKKIEKQTNVMDVIKINLNQLNEYYTINKVQARRSYSFSMIMITIGFVSIIGGIVLCYTGKIELNISLIASVSGLIAEFIGATSLLLYKENSNQAQLFFDKLSYLQHVMLAVELSERLNESNKEDKISLIISALTQKEMINKSK